MKYLKDKEYKRLLQDSYELSLVKKSLKRHIEVLDQYRQDNHDLTMALEAAKKALDSARQDDFWVCAVCGEGDWMCECVKGPTR